MEALPDLKPGDKVTVRDIWETSDIPQYAKFIGKVGIVHTVRDNQFAAEDKKRLVTIDFGSDRAVMYAYRLKKVEDAPMSGRFSTFYIIWNPASNKPPTRQFDSYSEAAKVAEKMVIQHGGQFHVLKSVSTAERSEVTITLHE